MKKKSGSPLIVGLVAFACAIAACASANNSATNRSASSQQQAPTIASQPTTKPQPTVKPVNRSLPTALPCSMESVTPWSAVIRECPSLDCNIVSSLKRDSQVCVLGKASEAPDWYVVEAGSQHGYMHSSVLTVPTGPIYSISRSNQQTGQNRNSTSASNTGNGQGGTGSQVVATSVPQPTAVVIVNPPTVAPNNPPPPTAVTSRYRTGANCSDGWQSSATGSGACSHHGGVACWYYSDGTCTKP